MPTVRMEADGRCMVDFRLSAIAGAAEAWLVGDFNDWSLSATPMRRHDDGTFSATVPLAHARAYRFRYYLGDGKWENDWAADDYVPNDFGGSDSVIRTPGITPSAPTNSHHDHTVRSHTAGTQRSTQPQVRTRTGRN